MGNYYLCSILFLLYVPKYFCYFLLLKSWQTGRINFYIVILYTIEIFCLCFFVINPEFRYVEELGNEINKSRRKVQH